MSEIAASDDSQKGASRNEPKKEKKVRQYYKAELDRVDQQLQKETEHIKKPEEFVLIF